MKAYIPILLIVLVVMIVACSSPPKITPTQATKATEAAALLEGKALDAKLIDDAAKTAADATNPIDDTRSTAWYRRKATQALVKQLLSDIAA